MEINDLRIFQKVAYEKSISKAALKLGYAQSNITMRVKVLENELNTSLFTRNNNGAILTTNGEKLLSYADKIISLVDEARDEFLIPKDNLKLTIGATQTLSASRLPKLFTLFHKKHPKVSLVLKTEKEEALLDMLLKGDLDGIFIYDGYISNKVKEVFSFKEKVALISCNKIHDIKDITAPVIINTDKNCPYGKLINKWCSTPNSGHVSIIEFDSLESIITGVASGLGVALLPVSILPKNNNFYIYDLGEHYNELKVKFVIHGENKCTDELRRFIGILD